MTPGQTITLTTGPYAGQTVTALKPMQTGDWWYATLHRPTTNQPHTITIRQAWTNPS